MTCDRCDRSIPYNYYINDAEWMAAAGGVKEGHLCAHCLLVALGGLSWQIIWSEPMQKYVDGAR